MHYSMVFVFHPKISITLSSNLNFEQQFYDCTTVRWEERLNQVPVHVCKMSWKQQFVWRFQEGDWSCYASVQSFCWISRKQHRTRSLAPLKKPYSVEAILNHPLHGGRGGVIFWFLLNDYCFLQHFISWGFIWENYLLILNLILK